MGKIIAVCISKEKGTQKTNIKKAVFVKDHGIQDDAHAGNWHRQVSLLSYDKVLDFCEKGASVGDGDFGENLLVESINFRELPVGTKLICNQVELEITQIGKECHSHCAIYSQVGDCIMPREGVFARVLNGGEISVGDIMHVKN